MSTKLHLATVTLLILLGMSAAQAHEGFTLHLGAAAVEQGDDGQRPSLLLATSYGSYHGHLFYFGREFAPVREHNLTLNIVRFFSLGPLPGVYWAFGGSVLKDSTSLNYRNPTLAGENHTQITYNAGLATGIYWLLPENLISKHLQVRLGWEASLYPAGIIGGLFLASGRRQFISLSVGTELPW